MNDLALRRKRELLGSNKRKMSLRKYIMSNLKQDECCLDITQVTKCVFLGALCLKPVPQLFDSPLLLAELDMRVGAVENTTSVSDDTTGEDVQPKNNNSENVVANKSNTEMKCLNEPKIKKKTVGEGKEPSRKVEIVKQDLDLEHEYLIIEEDNIPAVSPREERTYTELTVLSEPPPKVPPDSINVPEATDINIKCNIKKSVPTLHNVINQLSTETYLIMEQEALNAENLDIMPPDIDFETNAQFEDPSNLKREQTPELILSDSDEDAIDQLMFNIMDIKVPLSFEKDFFGMSMSPTPNIKQYQDEYSNEFDTTPQTPPAEDKYGTPKENKKLPKRTPQCKICSQVFNNYMQLKKHKPAHDGEKPYICANCNESHGSLDQLLAHLRIHQGKRPYVCKKCNKGFKSLKSLENHQPVHVLRKVTSPKKVFQCEICLKEFRKLCDLERHTRVHTGEKPSVCNICNRRFQQAHNLNKHLLIHTKEKPFQCDICHKKFGRSDVLNRHLLTHSVKKPNRCEICMKSFIRASQLLAHREKCLKGDV